MDRLENSNIVTEMQKSFLEYSMSVIISRAIPDLRDGMKPVHRRILYTTPYFINFCSSKYLMKKNLVASL